MHFRSKIAALLALLILSACTSPSSSSSAAVIGGTYYAVQYDFAEFFAATDHRNFQVILVGNPFPNMDPNTVARDLLPVMQAAKPRPALTFTYEAAPERPHPWYRLVLVFNSAPDLGSYCGVQWRDANGTAPARPLLCLCRLLSKRPGDVGNHRVGSGDRPGRSAGQCAVPPIVPGRVHQLPRLWS